MDVASYTQEQEQLVNNFLHKTFFAAFKRDKAQSDYNQLELQLKSKCNLKCHYCYYNEAKSNGVFLNPASVSCDYNLRKNIDLLLNYFEANEYYPASISIYGGEVTAYPVTYEIIEKLIQFYSKAKRSFTIVIPTNGSFIADNAKLKQINQLQDKAKKAGGVLGFSLSIDGKYMDPYNRPLLKGNSKEFYTDEYYNKIFQFAKNFGFGFHPMIHFNRIDKWIDNFLWFQKKFKEFDIPWSSIYLLEVRNDGWTQEAVKEYVKFYKFVLEFCLEKYGYNLQRFLENYIFNFGTEQGSMKQRMNMFNNVATTNRGIGCSIQNTLQLRLGDLTATPCHRQSYDYLNGFRFTDDGEKITGIQPLNFEYYFMLASTDTKNFPYCETCLIVTRIL